MLGLGVLSIVGAIALASTPFGATSHRTGAEQSFDCRSPLSAVRTTDPGPGLAAFFRQGRGGPPIEPTAAPPTSAAFRSLAAQAAKADRYHVCHPAAMRRLVIAGVLAFVGIWILARWWYRLPPSAFEDAAPNEFLESFGYNAALDGVRAVSILLVLGRHLGLRGVFIAGDHGVDIFFVLSGFLITTLLLKEHNRAGRISLRDFYVRRALRLYPAVLVLLVIGATVYLLYPSFPNAPAWSGLLATSFYYANWMHHWNASAQGFLSPTWSLAIEEQFYLFWPPIVAVLLARGRGRLALGVAACTGAVVAAVWRGALAYHALHWPSSAAPDTAFVRAAVRYHRAQEFDRWYFNSFAHADTLLVGCLLAILLTPPVVLALRARPRIVLGLAWLAAAVIAYLCMRETVLGGHTEVAPGGRVANGNFVPIWGLPVFEIAVALVLLALVTVPTGVMGSFLSHRMLTWTGRRSYGLYVLHLPVFELVASTIPATGTG